MVLAVGALQIFASRDFRNELAIALVRANEGDRDRRSPFFQARNRKQEIDVVLVRPELRGIENVRLFQTKSLDRI